MKIRKLVTMVKKKRICERLFGSFVASSIFMIIYIDMVPLTGPRPEWMRIIGPVLGIWYAATLLMIVVVVLAVCFSLMIGKIGLCDDDD